MSADATAVGSPAGTRWRTGVPLVVWALVVVHTLLLVAWTVVVPAWYAPDEPHHLDMAFQARSGQGWPGPDERQLSARITGTFPLTGFAFEGVRDLPPLRADDATDRSARPSFSEVAPDVPSGATNWMWQHPPLYYAGLGSTLAIIETLVPGAAGWSFDRELGTARLLTVGLVAWLPLLAWCAARRLGGSRSVGISAAVLVLAFPQLTHMGSTVTNDGLLILLFGLLTVELTGVATGDTGRGTALRVATLTGVALLTKGFALLAFGWIPLAYLLAARTVGRPRPAERRYVHRAAALRAGVLAAGGAAVLGGWWTVRNLVLYGSVQPRAFRTGGPEGFVPDGLAWAETFVRWTVERFWGSFGWYQAALPRPLVWTAALLLVLAVAAGLWHRRVGLGTVLDRLLLLVPTGALLVLMAYGAWAIYSDTGFFGAIQGRYLLPGLVGLVVVAAAGGAAVAGRRAAPLATLALAVCVQGAAAAVVLQTFWAAEGGGRIGAVLAWSPWPPAVLGAVAVALVAAILGVLALLVVEARRPEQA